jgi:hypothetical protein
MRNHHGDTSTGIREFGRWAYGKQRAGGQIRCTGRQGGAIIPIRTPALADIAPAHMHTAHAQSVCQEKDAGSHQPIGVILVVLQILVKQKARRVKTIRAGGWRDSSRGKRTSLAMILQMRTLPLDGRPQLHSKWRVCGSWTALVFSTPQLRQGF